VIGCVPAAFGVLVMAKGKPLPTAIYSAALSGDADTIGAMACAMAGAWQGAAAFDPAHIATLRTVNPELDFDGIAAGLAALAQQNQQRGTDLHKTNIESHKEKDSSL
jgi:ADP-ribosylglycohydrolase